MHLSAERNFARRMSSQPIEIQFYSPRTVGSVLPRHNLRCQTTTIWGRWSWRGDSHCSTERCLLLFLRVLYLNLQRACNEWLQLERERGRAGRGEMAAACPPCGCNCNCNWGISWIMQTLAKVAHSHNHSQSRQSCLRHIFPTVFPQRRQTNKLFVIIAGWHCQIASRTSQSERG